MDTRIEQWRKTALGLLQPSRAQEEHGLALHRETLVIDAYGFAPRAAPDGDRLKKAVEAGGSRLEFQDLLEDMTMTRAVRDPEEGAIAREAWDAAGVACIVQNAGQEGQAIDRLIKRLARFTYAGDCARDLLRRAARPGDIEDAHRAGFRCLYLTGNGVPLPQRWESVEEELAYIRIFFQLGIRMMHLTYNRRNMIGDGCAEPANAGLSDFGRAVVAEMNRAGVIVDVAHAGWQTSLEAATISGRPVVASHTVCGALNPHIRSKPDAVIRAIAGSGGYIGICCVPSFLGGNGDIRTLLDHLDYAIRTFGADHVAIGTDTVYLSPHYQEELRKVPDRGKARPGWENFWPPQGAFRQEPQQAESLAWTNWPLFTVGLVQHGHSDETIRKVLGENVMRVARAAWPA